MNQDNIDFGTNSRTCRSKTTRKMWWFWSTADKTNGFDRKFSWSIAIRAGADPKAKCGMGFFWKRKLSETRISVTIHGMRLNGQIPSPCSCPRAMCCRGDDAPTRASKALVPPVARELGDTSLTGGRRHREVESRGDTRSAGDHAVTARAHNWIQSQIRTEVQSAEQCNAGCAHALAARCPPEQRDTSGRRAYYARCHHRDGAWRAASRRIMAPSTVTMVPACRANCQAMPVNMCDSCDVQSRDRIQV
jgi:hypothetical protein